MMSVERAMAKAAASLLPGLLPTPPTKPCLIILPASFNSKTKPGRADCVERWDAHKKDKKPTKTPASSCSSSSSPGRASSCERWDVNKQISGSSRTSSSSSSSSRRSSTSPGASSAGRWDAHMKEKPRPAQASAGSRTSDKEEEETTAMMVTNPAAPPRMGPMSFSGPSFFVASPDPSMLPVPVPAFFRPRNPGVLPVQAAFLGVH